MLHGNFIGMAPIQILKFPAKIARQRAESACHSNKATAKSRLAAAMVCFGETGNGEYCSSW